jgi:hypothetical protein
MGWSGGTALMETILEAIEPLTKNVDQDVLDKALNKIIAGFEAQDWDCENEIIGRFSMFDRAYFLNKPEEHGYHTAIGNPIASSIPRPTGKAASKKWQSGFDEGVSEIE